MKCHYEVLNVPRDADEGDIKLSYKKLALKWHPDKNLENIEHATEQFQLVQQAYEILSDRQERAWYDNHREQILRGSNSDFKDNNLDVFQYFTTTCFNGYGDDSKGFYAVYGNIFEQITKEDLEHMSDKEEFSNIPMFGNSTSDYYDIVAPFYNFWTSYSTKKSYVWLDPYNIREAKNRRVLKLIEKENDKVRLKAKRERNEEVRSLVAFVRKRDKRVQVHAKSLEAKNIENRQKQERISKEKRLERIKQLNESSEQADWMKFENVKFELEEVERKLAKEFGDDISGSDENSDDEDDLDHLYCIACNKIFKNPRAFENHESSKKHKESVDRLKYTMIREEVEIDKNLASSRVSSEEILLSDEEIDNIPEQNRTLSKKKKKKKAKNIIDVENTVETTNTTDSVNVTESDDCFENLKKEKRNKKKNNKLKNSKSDVLSNIDNGVKPDDEVKPENKGKKKELRKGKKAQHVESDEIDKDHCCVMCRSSFDSKNKLFDHLKKTGHSAFITPSSSKTERSKKTVKEK